MPNGEHFLAAEFAENRIMQLCPPSVMDLKSLLNELEITASESSTIHLAEQRQVSCSCRRLHSSNNHSIDRCKECLQAGQLENLIVERLGKRCFPIVAGMLDRLSKRIEELGGRVGDSEAYNVSFIVAHRLFWGTCNCLEEGDDLRIRRDGPCGEEHKLRSWDPSTDLNSFLKLALLNEKDNAGKFAGNTPNEIRADCFNLLKQRSPKDMARGMALRQVNFDILGRSIILGVFQIPRCKTCKTEVSINNRCHCNAIETTQWPDVPELSYIIDACSVRCSPNTDEAFPMYRSKQTTTGGCVHGGDKDAGGILLFPIRSEATNLCPLCKQPASGKSSNPQIPVKHIRSQRGTEGLQQLASTDNEPSKPTDPLTRLTQELLCATGPDKDELNKLGKCLRSLTEDDRVPTGTELEQLFAGLSTSAREFISELFR